MGERETTSTSGRREQTGGHGVPGSLPFHACFAAVPIRTALTVKEDRSENDTDQKLSVSVTVESEAGITSRGNAFQLENTSTRDTPASIISLAGIIRGVKDKWGDW